MLLLLTMVFLKDMDRFVWTYVQLSIDGVLRAVECFYNYTGLPTYIHAKRTSYQAQNMEALVHISIDKY